MTMIKYDEEPLPGDYYGVIYKGPFLVPILGIVLVIGALWYLKKRRQ